jgi:hypothetical protein
MRCSLASALLVLLSCGSAHAAVPLPLAFWKFQEAEGSPRVSTGAQHSYALHDGNASLPIQRVAGGVFGPWSAYFPSSGGNDSQRLYATREAAPAITAGIAGPDAVVTLVAWVSRSAADLTPPRGEFIGGVWDENLRARQYALFTHLAVCAPSTGYQGGSIAHISPVGGPTPGSLYCETAACDTPALAPDDWHCLANVYDGVQIVSYTNATMHSATMNPFPLTGGIFSPEATGRAGAEFGVGANYINATADSPRTLANRFKGRLGGLAVFDVALAQSDVAAVCAWAAGFG